MKKILLLLVLLLLLLGVRFPVHASTITYDVLDLTGGYWQYNYLVTNTSSDTITEFSITFEYALYAVLDLPNPTLVNWDQSVWEPVDIFNDGYYFATSQSSYLGIGPGASESGFSVSFLWWTDMIPPGEQGFDIIYSLGDVESGLTTPATVPVPEPGILILLSSSLLCIAGLRRMISD